MAYERQYYTNGDVLNAEQLNHMEAGIKENSDSVSKLSEEKANRIVETASGEVIVVTDSDEKKPLGLAIDGKSEQNQYSGNQLYDHSYRNTNNEFVCVNGRATESNGIFTVTVDKADARVWEIANKDNVYAGFSNGPLVEKPEGATQINVVLSNEAFYQNFITFYDENKVSLGFATYTGNNFVIKGDLLNSSKYLSLRFGLGTAVSSGTYETTVMMNVGETALPWEPFVGGKPSPSTEYEQKIRNIGVYDEASGKYAVEVKCTGKNLLPNNATNQTIKGIDFSVNENKSITANGTATGWVEVVLETTLPKGTYVLNGCPSGGSSGTYLFYLPKARNGFESDINDIGNGNTFTLEKTQKVYACIVVTNGTTLSNAVFKPMIRPAEIADNTYEPYKETTATVYLDEPLRKDDVIRQKDGVWGVERNRLHYTFTGNENINQMTVDKGYRYNFTALNVFLGNGHDYDVLCNRLIPLASPPNGILIHGSDGYPIMYLSDIATVSELQAFLSENETYIEAYAKNPTFTAFEDQSIFDGLSMFYPTTVISNDCNANMEVEYIADTKAYIDKKFAELATAMV